MERRRKLHEINVMNQVVQSVLQKAHDGQAQRIILVRLQIGELTFLGPMQMNFAFDILKENEPILKDTKLVIEETKATGKCANCGFKGLLNPAELPEYHFKIPSLDCPKCKKKLEIIKGRDLVIKEIEIEK
jgi:hydrogenase nickel incorporation protein HypA/HybF